METPRAKMFIRHFIVWRNVTRGTEKRYYDEEEVQRCIHG